MQERFESISVDAKPLRFDPSTDANQLGPYFRTRLGGVDHYTTLTGLSKAEGEEKRVG